MRRTLLCLVCTLALVGPTAAVALTARPSVPVSAPAPPPGPHRVQLLVALNPIAGVEEAGRFVEGANVAKVHAAADLIDARTVYAADAKNRAAAAPRITYSAPPSVPVVSGGAVSSLSCGPYIDGLLAQYFGNDYAWAERIVHRESSCQPGARNGKGCDSSGQTDSHAIGLFQMCYPQHLASFVAAGCANPYDAACGIEAARKLYDADGRAPWGG